MTEAAIKTARVASVFELTIRRPARRNALDRGTLGEIRSRIAGLGSDVRAVILTGDGGVFGAGADLTEIQGGEEDLHFDELLAEVVAAIAGAPQLIIAAVEGACIGASLELALACDACIASESAFFALPAVRLGLLYNPSTVARMHASLPRQALTRLLLLGERLDAPTAAALGLLTRLTASGCAMAEARELAASVLGDPSAFAASKELLGALDGGLAELERFEPLRRELVASPARRAALAHARSRVGRQPDLRGDV